MIMIHLQHTTPVDTVMDLAEITLMIIACLMKPGDTAVQSEGVSSSHDLRWFGKGVHQLSGAGFRLDWQCFVRMIMLLDQTRSLCLRKFVLSVLIRPLSVAPSLTAVFTSKVCKSENNSLSHPVISSHHSLCWSFVFYIWFLLKRMVQAAILVPQRVLERCWGGGCACENCSEA